MSDPTPPNQPSPQSPTQPPPPSAPYDHSLFSPRSRRQLTLFFAGATFFTLSIFTTRRSIQRRHASLRPHFYQPSNAPPRIPISGGLDAVQALGLASLNVASWALMMTGGVLWAFDISSMRELQRRVRGGLGVDGSGRGEEEVEQEFEEWIASVLARKEDKERARGGVEEVRRVNERGAER